MTPTFYTLVFFWTEEAMNNLSVALDFCALTIYGGALLATPILPRWGGWTTLISACAGLGLVILTGATYDSPEFVYLLLGFLGVLLLRRGRQLPTKGYSG